MLGRPRPELHRSRCSRTSNVCDGGDLPVSFSNSAWASAFGLSSSMVTQHELYACQLLQCQAPRCAQPFRTAEGRSKILVGATLTRGAMRKPSIHSGLAQIRRCFR